METNKYPLLIGMIEDNYNTRFWNTSVSVDDVKNRSSPTSSLLIGKEKTVNSSKRLGKNNLMGYYSNEYRGRGQISFHTNDKGRGNKKSMFWWSPPQDSLPVEFCQATSLHGLKYIGQPKRHLSERIFWLVAYLVSLSVAIWLISEMWNKYKMNPVIVSFQPFETNVDQIPFPAITICNMNKVMKSKAEQFIQRALNGDEEAQRDVYYLEHVCTSTQSFSRRFNYSIISRNGIGAGVELEGSQREELKLNNTAHTENLTRVNRFLRKAAQNCSDMIPLCAWHDQEVDCSKLFRPIETEYGKCCTFNMIPLTLLYTRRDDPKEIRQWLKWDIDQDGLLLTLPTDELEFPRRQMKAGLTNGLSFLLNVNYKEYYCTSSDSVGFRMAAHLSVELPKVADFGISLKPKSEMFVDIDPAITMVDQDIFSFSLEKRNCYKSGEYKLAHYKYYSVNNCIDECIANQTRDTCGCKRYYMPRNVTEPLCGPQKFECAEDVRYLKTKYGIRNTCSMCLQSCTEIYYEPQTTATPLREGVWRHRNGSTSIQWDHNDISIVHVYVGQDSFYAKVRKELYGLTDLFANTGGLMGLCLGFSGLSLMEVIYFLTLRAWWKNRRKRAVISTEEHQPQRPNWVSAN